MSISVDPGSCRTFLSVLVLFGMTWTVSYLPYDVDDALQI